jgi:hypothetical protein
MAVASQTYLSLDDLKPLLPHEPLLERFCQGATELYNTLAAETYQVMVPPIRGGLVVATIAAKLVLFHQAQLLEQSEAAVDRG